MNPQFLITDIQLCPNKCLFIKAVQKEIQVSLWNHTPLNYLLCQRIQTRFYENVAEQLAKGGYFYIMHPVDDRQDISFLLNECDQGLIASISVGVKDYEYDFALDLTRLMLQYITIDIAHFVMRIVISMIQHIKKELPQIPLSSGNVGTPEAVRELENAGADATKVGIGSLVRFVSPRLRLVLVQVVGLASLLWCVPRVRVNLLSLMEEFVLTVILPSLSASVSMIIILVPSAWHILKAGKTIEKSMEQFKEYYGSASHNIRKVLTKME